MKHRSLIALALTIGGAGCYSPGLSDCVSACGAGGTCARDMTCSNGLCTRGPVCNVNEPPPPTSSCIESTRRCVSGQTQSCNGGKWAALATCADQTPACFAGGCVECPPGSARCRGPGAIQQCGPGGGWGPDLNCLGGAICQNGACVSTAGVTAVSAGESHTCALLATKVKCWGDNQHLQLGLTDRSPRGVAKNQMGDFLPFLTLPGAGVVAIAAGGAHTCSIVGPGDIMCWGDNAYGQLGGPPATAEGTIGARLPNFVAAAVVTGQAHSCALSSDGSVTCWGDNRFGQLGLGSDEPSITGTGSGGPPPLVDLGTGINATGIAAGAFHTCALLGSGQVKCWGDNEYGQLGQGDVRDRGGPGDLGDNLSAVPLGTSAIVSAIAAGGFHTCALLTTGAIKCWGDNAAGQLGIGSTANKGTTRADLGDALPAVALGKGPVPIAIAAGEAHTCALLADGAVKCWGGGLHGQLGSGSRDSQGNAPTPALEDAPPVDLGTAGGVPLAATAISAGADHTCALLTSGDLKCWGLNNVGQLGQESTATLGDDRMEMGDNLPPIRLGTPAPP